MLIAAISAPVTLLSNTPNIAILFLLFFYLLDSFVSRQILSLIAR